MAEKLKGFYVVEGMDGSGKTTFCNSLKLSLEKSGKPCIILNESEDPAFTRAIRDVLKSDMVSPTAEAYLFAAARANCVSQMKNFLAHHKDGIVIFDRYIPSSYVYQTEKVPIEEVRHINKNFPIPEVVFWLDVDAETAVKRIAGRSEKAVEKYEKAEMLKRWRQKYTDVLFNDSSELSYNLSKEAIQVDGVPITLHSKSPQELAQSTTVIKIDASKETDEMIDQAFNNYLML